MKPYRIFPGQKGLYRPISKYNPVGLRGFSTLMNWKVKEGVLTLGPGTEPAFPNWLLHPLKLEESAVWTATNVTLSGRTYYGDDGTLTAQKIIETTATGNHQLAQSVTASLITDGSYFWFSAYLKDDGRDKIKLVITKKDATTIAAKFDLTAKTAVVETGTADAYIEDYGDGVFRCSVHGSIGSGATDPAFTIRLTSNWTESYAGDTAKGVIVWGSQVQFGNSGLLPFTLGVNTLTPSSPPWLMAVQEASGSGPHPKGDTKYYYISGQALRKIVESGEDEAVVTASFLAGTSTSRLASCLFRNHVLVAHKTEGLKWIKPSDDTFRAAGVDVPASKPTASAGAAGDLTGTYKYVVTYVNDKGHEGNPKMAGTVADSASVVLAAQKGNLSSIPTGPTGIAKRRIYRTIANGDTFLYLTEIPDNTTTTLTGDNTADSALGSALQYDNDIPPATIQQILATSTRVYLVDTDGETLWASKIDPFTAEPNWEAYPYNLSQKLPFSQLKDTFQAVFELGGFLHCAGRKKIFRISGDIGTGIVVNKVLDEGFFSRFTWEIIGDRLVFLNGSKKLRAWSGEGNPTDIGEDVQDLLQDIYEPSGLQEPSVVYNEKNDEIYVGYMTSPGSALNKALTLDVKTGVVAQTSLVLGHPVYVPSTGKLIGTGSAGLYTALGYRNLGSKYGTQIAETVPATPLPGSEVMFGSLVLLVKAVPIVNFVPPTLKVEYALDESIDWKTKMVDLTRDFLSKGEGETPIVKTLYVPIQERAGSVKVRVSAVDNKASLDNGIEIYDISAEVISEAYEQEGEKAYAVDRKE